eukprot:c28657_g1_i1 orf=423-3248(+)
MAHSAQGNHQESGQELTERALPAAVASFSDNSNEANDDWVSLLLNDTTIDLDIDRTAPLASLTDFPLADFDETDLVHIDEYGSIVHYNSNSIGFPDLTIAPTHHVGLATDSDSFCTTTSSSSPDKCFGDFISCFNQVSFADSMAAAETTSSQNVTGSLNSMQTENLSHTQLPIQIMPLMELSSTQQSEGFPSLCYSISFPTSSVSRERSPCGMSCASPPPPGQLGVSQDVSNLLCSSYSSPDSGLTRGSNDPSMEVETDVNIEVFESNASMGSEEGSLSYRANEACMSYENRLHTPISSAGDLKLIAPATLNRKRKAVDRKSRSTTPEDTSGDNSGRCKSSLEDPRSGVGDEQKRQARLMRNRESAQLSRQRKKTYVDELEERIKTMTSTIAELNNTIGLISAENINLRRQLGFCCQPPPCGKPSGIPMAVPWVPVNAYSSPILCGRFLSGNSQVPLVPIPRLKSHQTAVRKPRKSKPDSEKKETAEKVQKRTKKVAGVAIVGLFFFMVLFQPLNWSFSGMKMFGLEHGALFPGWQETRTGHSVVRAGGRVLTSWNEEEDPINRMSTLGNPHTKCSGLNSSKSQLESEQHSDNVPSKVSQKGLQAGNSRGNWQPVTSCGRQEVNDAAQPTRNLSGGGVYAGNTSELSAMLFVPRNDKLVRIDGNLIIHSVLAGDRAARESRKPLNGKGLNRRGLDEKGLALARDFKVIDFDVGKEKGVQTQEIVAAAELQKALSANPKVFYEGGVFHSEKTDGSLQQWFMEGLAGPILSSGMCTEVFQFETTPASSSSKSASTIVNDVSPTASSRKADTYVKNSTDGLHEQAPRRAGPQVQSSSGGVSYAVPLLPARQQATFINGKRQSNETHGTEQIREADEFMSGKGRHSSLVVSILVGSPEFRDEARLSRGSTGLSEIFVVVLIDSVKYVTYSCMIPSKGSQPQFVTG